MKTKRSKTNFSKYTKPTEPNKAPASGAEAEEEEMEIEEEEANLTMAILEMETVSNQTGITVIMEMDLMVMVEMDITVMVMVEMDIMLMEMGEGEIMDEKAMGSQGNSSPPKW